MPPLPAHFAPTILTFAPLFVQRSWRYAQVLLIGAILTPGRRTVASLLRVTGHVRERQFVNYHRVLSRAAWNPRAGGRILLGLLISAFAPRGPVVLALDDTIERRWGRRIKARGIYLDPVRSSEAHFVKASGLRWMSLMLLAPIPWAERIWALPFLTALVPSERACREQGHRHKPLLDIGRQLALQARRWLPGCDLVLVGDSGFSALLFLDALRPDRRMGRHQRDHAVAARPSTSQPRRARPARSGGLAPKARAYQPWPTSSPTRSRANTRSPWLTYSAM